MSAPITVAYIFHRYPTLSETFLQREVTALWKQGLRIEIHSSLCPQPGEQGDPPGGLTVDYFHWWEAIKLLVAFPRELCRDPALARDACRMLRRHRFTSAENFFSTLWATVFALCRAEQFRRNKPDIIHGSWATGAATAAAILSRCCGIPFSFGGYAYDIYRRGGDAFLQSKLQAASFVHTETEANVVYLREKAASRAVNIVLSRRGLALLPDCPERNRKPGPIRILSVARLVPKKGHIHQLAACATLKEWGIPFQLKVVGDGPLRRRLQRRIASDGLSDSVTLCGARPQEEVQEAYRWADIFWHTGIIAPDGDRDGLPNVVPEAMAHRLPVICGHVPGVTEAVENETTGLIVDVSKAAELAGAVRRLTEDEPLRRRLGEAGRRWVEHNFVTADNIGVLAKAFREAVDRSKRR